MKSLSFVLFALSLTSTSSFAQDYLKCSLNIKDNKVPCPSKMIFWEGKCPQKELRESKTELNVQVFDGQPEKGQITFNKVILFPGTSREAKNKVILFTGDPRLERVRDQKKVDLVSYESKNSVDYRISKSGRTIQIKLDSSVYNLDLSLSGNARINGVMYTGDNAMFVKCEIETEAVHDDRMAKEVAIKKHQDKKAKKASAKKQ